MSAGRSAMVLAAVGCAIAGSTASSQEVTPVSNDTPVVSIPSTPAGSSAVDPSSMPAFPFYDANGEKLGPPPTETPSNRSPFILAPSLEVGELVIPDLESAGALVVPTVEIGNDLFAGGLGYANLAGIHGLDLEAALGRFGSAARLFDSRGWRGSLILPDLEAEFGWFPGQTTLPSWMLGLKSNIVGFRLAKCFGKTSFELSMSAVTASMLVDADQLYFGQTVGGRFDIGAAFWR